MAWWYELRGANNRLVEMRRGFATAEEAQEAGERAKSKLQAVVLPGRAEEMVVVTGDDVLIGQIKSELSDSLSKLRVQLETESSDGIKLLNNLKDNPICSVSLEESVPCIKVIWKQYATSTQLRFIHESILRLLQKHGVVKILGDDTALLTIHAEDQAWIVHDWMPRAIAAGLKFASSKNPDSYFGKVSVSSVQSALPIGIVVRSFERLDDAKRWLSGVSPADPTT